jgi:proton-dependent oligopeptide transporter, POT family
MASPDNSFAPSQATTLLGHPVGLFTLFFAEMWERFSYYGMRALLVFYMTKGFLGYGDHDANAIYGAYTALVYMTPFFGGMLADRLLGQRRAVIFGGLLMAAGHLLMTVENSLAFFTALALLIAGNGFFKPNIATIVGSLYPKGSPRRDGGFTIFYMGVNLGAALAPLLCGYIGEHYDWHYGFGLATIGMLTGVAIFAAPTLLTQILIFGTAGAAAVGLLLFRPDNPFSIGVNVFVAISLAISGAVALMALDRGGIPHAAGRAPRPERLRRPLVGPINTEIFVYLATGAAVLIFALLVSGFAPLTRLHHPISLVSDQYLAQLNASSSRLSHVCAIIFEEVSRPAALVLMLSGLIGLGYLGLETVRLDRIARQRMYVFFILTFFSMLFWSFFEQAGTSLNNFTDRNVDRVTARRQITAADVGKTIRLEPTQKQVGYHNGTQLFTLNVLDALREAQKKTKASNPDFTIPWIVADDNVGMGLAGRNDEVPASTFQSVNAVFILIFGLVFTSLWTWLGRRGWEPNTPVKFAMGLLQLGLGFAAFWYGVQTADARGMVALGWLVLGYLLHTTGELCLSPVGLAMVTRLAPAKLVSTMMGAWFLAMAFSQTLAALIAQFTGVTEGNGGSIVVPPPRETVHVYGDVFGKIALGAMAAAIICFLLAPLLSRWMHTEEQ